MGDEVVFAADRDVWARQPRESPRDYELYRIYYRLGPDRSHELTLGEWNRGAAADPRRKAIRSVRTVERASVRGGWVVRCAAQEDADYALYSRRYRLRDAEQRAKNAELLGHLAERCTLYALEAQLDAVKPAELLRASGDLVRKHWEVTSPRTMPVQITNTASATAGAVASAELLEQDQEHGRHEVTLARLLGEIGLDTQARESGTAPPALPAGRSKTRGGVAGAGFANVLGALGDDDDEDQEHGEGGR